MLQNTGKYQREKVDIFKKKFDPGESEDRVPRENTAEGRINLAKENIKADTLYRFLRVTDNKERIGFLINFHTTDIIEDDKRIVSGVDYYFLEEDCTRFKVSMPYYPYFYILCKKDTTEEVSNFLMKKYTDFIARIETVQKDDLDLPNHLIGLKQTYLKLSFINTIHLNKIRKDIVRAVKQNKERASSNRFYTELLTHTLNSNKYDFKSVTDHMENILDIREYDVPHHIRVSIDLKIFIGSWYSVKTQGNMPPIITKRQDLLVPPELVVLAYDIETTKLPLKFPDANNDQIMMISYMIDGQGYLITNREIISMSIEDFEYSPKPEFQGFFKVFNEPNEKATIKRFFDHINEIKPHIFVTYNGDFFDWPFVETRAAIHGIDMKERIGFAKNRENIYMCRAALHMDCLCWVKRDSYLPVGSHNLKAVAKAKLRYDPVELDPEDMCRLASEEPETLANYSVSDAVATYYLYYKYIHPFIFALCTIIPMEPDEVLRKGSGTLCESLLMVEAFHANIIFPNKQETEVNKFKDGQLLDQETYVGGHVEALESGVFRADIPYRFKIIPSIISTLIDGVERALKYTIIEEEKIPMNMVLNFEEVVEDIKKKLIALKEQPLRLEKPIIYHLDVGAMYPNIILTNRLQPSAMVNETICAACDYNKPDALCKRQMKWMWRGELMVANLGEYQRIQQQLEMEKFPPEIAGGPRRAFHQLSKQEQALHVKKRLTEYCKKVYKKVKITRTEERTQTVCQKENSFYVNTVRAFRDRRYEYKGLTKVAKQEVSAAIAKGDAAEIKCAKSKEILYDSLQLAHKCILNSFYGYVMRKGSRWFSMEMGGVVCYTGAHIIMKAREIIEQIGRPLELDTDGIWCILPASFPDNIVVKTTHPKKKEITLSYPNTVLNTMVKDEFTNNVYHELVDAENFKYEIRSENSIFFEVDGPYLAMILPASKEEGKKLKKRYAVFNFDGSLAELKGFEVKRRGELQLIKIFQSTVFESFLKGKTLEECYASVASVANYWLDMLYSKGANIPDSELFELISENKSLSRQLDDYGLQKSTSISTAKRLAEFLGDQMVKDAGLACKYIISKKPEGAPVTERAIPLAIFQSEPNVTRHYLRKWLKDSSIQDFNIREILDWNYYIERLGSTIQKIITIPAAMQGVANPVPRLQHPDWLRKKLMEKTDMNKQPKISEMFGVVQKPDNHNTSNSSFESNIDIEDITDNSSVFKVPVSTHSKRKHRVLEDEEDEREEENSKSWKQVFGSPPPMGTTKEERQIWLEFHKKKWMYQMKQRHNKKNKRNRMNDDRDVGSSNAVVRNFHTSTITGFIKHAKEKLLHTPWQIIQLVATNEPGLFRVWILVDEDLHQVRLTVPRIFYVNSRKDRGKPKAHELWERCSKILPRSRPVYHLYKYSCPETQYQKYSQAFVDDLNTPDIEGIYETQMSLEFRAILQLGCICVVDKNSRGYNTNMDSFHLDQLRYRGASTKSYLKQPGVLKYIFLYHHWSTNHQRAIWGLFLTADKKAFICVQDVVRTEKQISNINILYSNERSIAIEKNPTGCVENTPESLQFEIHVQTSVQQVCRIFQSALKSYKQNIKGATIVVIQTDIGRMTLVSEMPILNDFPIIDTHMRDVENFYTSIDWQKVGASKMLRHYFTNEHSVQLMIELSEFFHAPIGNIPAEPFMFGADLFYARHLQKNNFVLWCSLTEKPDFGGSENDDNRLLTDFEESSSCTINNAGTYSNMSVEIDVDSLAINTLLQSHQVHDIDGTSSFVAFHNAPQTSIQDIVTNDNAVSYLPIYDETALCMPAFKVLKSMVNVWVRDVSLYSNVFADSLIIHFYRWLRSPNSLLYDPALRRTLHNFMKKMFIQLIAEFQRLGSVIVHANFNKIILCTKKTEVQDAVEYIMFISKSIQNKELFHSINFTLGKCWQYLIWMDFSNYAGIEGIPPKSLNESDDRNEEGNNEDNLPSVEMKWNLMEYIPEEIGCRETFRSTIAAFIVHINRQIRKNLEKMTPRSHDSHSSILGQESNSLQDVHNLEDTVVYATKLISGVISQKLFQVIQKIHKKMPKKKILENEYSYLTLNTSEGKEIIPALELIKAICKVLSLDKKIEEEVLRLKRNLLKLIGIGFYSDEAEWRDPCVSYILPEVTCQECSHIRDVDLCKDIYCATESNKMVWKCSNCHLSYNNDDIEFTLIDILNRKIMAYMLQDLQCEKCSEIQKENMNQLCNCTGTFKTMESRDEIIKFVKVIKYVAAKSQMELLNELLNNTELLLQ